VELGRRRVPWRAALLSVVTPGVGELYSGRPFRAIIVYLLWLGIQLICIRAVFILLQPWNIIVPVAGILLLVLLVLGDAIRCARMAAPDYRLKAYNRWYIYLLCVVLVGAGQRTLRPFLLARGIKNVTASMLPTMAPGDRFFVDKRAYLGRMPQRGDIISFRYPRNPSIMYVKRVIAVGGDVVRIHDRQVFVNGKALSEAYAYYQASIIRPFIDNFPPPLNEIYTLPAAWGLDQGWAREMHNFIGGDGLHVPENSLFVLGDNREYSADSRLWGFVPRANVLGKAAVIYFSWDAEARRVRWDRLGEILK
jgi:signal peptidase I